MLRLYASCAAGRCIDGRVGDFAHNPNVLRWTNRTDAPSDLLVAAGSGDRLRLAPFTLRLSIVDGP